MRRLALRTLAVLAVVAQASAHDGPPYPIAVDEALVGHTISVWADPDVGTGTFYFYVDPEDALASHPAIRIAVLPMLEGVPNDESQEFVALAREADADAPYQLIGEVPFEHRGDWAVRFLIEEAGRFDEIALTVDVTPPGLGRFDLIWFLSPFLAIGLLWIRGVTRRRQMYEDAQDAPA